MKVKILAGATGILLALLLQANTALAATKYVALTPDREGDIRQGSADVSFDTAAQHWVRYSSAAYSCKSYIRFKLPSDFRAATSVQLRLTRTSDQGGSFKHSVWGLKDGIAGETTWAGQTWNSALAHNPSAAGTGYSFTSDATYLGYFRSDAVGVVGQNLFSSASFPALLDFVNSDTNGYITLMLCRPVDEDSTSANEFATKYTGTSPAPALEINYEPLALETVDLNPVADTFIKAGNPDLVFDQRAYLAIQNSTQYPDRNMKIYMKFHVPAADLHITTAALKITTMTDGHTPPWVWSFNVVALKDGVAGGDWIVGGYGTYTGPPSGGMTWNNAPANDTTNGTGFTSNATSSLGVFVTTDPNDGAQNTMTSANLAQYLASHPDQDVTLMMARVEDSSVEMDFASTANTTYKGPVLEVSGYRCAQLIGDINNDCYINFRDISQMIADWLSCTNPNPAKCH